MAVVRGLGTPVPGVLDPVAASVLEQLSSVPRFCDMTIDGARDVVAKLAGDFSGDPPQMSSVTSRTVRSRGRDVDVVTFVPSHARSGASPVLFTHGGGFITGSPQVYDAALRGLADALGRTVVAPTYPLSPEARFPEALDNVEAAYDWLADGHEHDLLGASGRVIVAGDSAGGNLTAALVNRLADRAAPPLAQVLLYPATNFADLDTESIRAFGTGHFITRDDLEYFMANYLPSDVSTSHPEVSPRLGLAGVIPPTLVITSEFDPLRSDGEEYARRLEGLGADVSYMCAAGQIHAFHLLPGLFPVAAEVNDEIRSFLNLHDFSESQNPDSVSTDN